MKLARHLSLLFALIAAIFVIATANSALVAQNFVRTFESGEEPIMILQLVSRALIWAVWAFTFTLASILSLLISTWNRQSPPRSE